MKENGDRLLKNIYTLRKINIFQLKFISDKDNPEKATEVVVSCFLYFGDFGHICLRCSPEPAENKMAEKRTKRNKKKSIPAQQMELRAGEEEESGEG